MHEHQRVARSLVTELLQELVENVVVAFYALIGFGNKILEQSRPLYKKREVSRNQFPKCQQVFLRNFLFCEYSRIKYEHSSVWWHIRSTTVFMNSISRSSACVRKL